MVNWHDPSLLLDDYSTPRGYLVVISPLTLTTYSSCPDQVESCPCRYLHVRLYSNPGKRALIRTYDNSSWEILISFGFELDILRGKRPYRWTIWVSSLQLSHITTTSMNVAISWNPLHGLAYFHRLFYRHRWFQGSLSSKACAVLVLKWISLLTFLFL